MEDWQLLEAYARRGSEAAFAELVDRHLGLVLAAARRQVRDDAGAADVAQAVFLLLARKAGSFGPKSVLAGWLFSTTRFVAARAVRADLRRQRREQEAVIMQETHAPDSHWSRLEPELDEALATLGETDRNALLLRFAEGQNHREVGRALGLSEEAAKKRAQRALEKLRSTLVRQGVTFSAIGLAGLLTERLCAAPPPMLAKGIARSVVSGGTSLGLAHELVQQTLAAWRWTQLKIAGAWLGAAALIALAFFLPSRPAAPPASTAQVAIAEPAQPAPRDHTPGVAPRLTGSEIFRFRVLAADSEQPLAGARVLLNFVSNDKWVVPEDQVTDADGVCLVPLPRGTLGRLDVGVHSPGYENRFFTWRSDWQHPLPSGYTLKVGRSESVGGQVVNDQGQPLPGVSVWLTYHISDTSWREPDEDRERIGFMRRILLGTTDADGRWLCLTIPSAREHFAFEFEHPHYVKEESLSVRRDDESVVGRQTLALLRSRKAVTTMRSGAVASGLVVNGAGEPVVGARVGTSWHDIGATTDSTGQFSLRSLPRGNVSLTATADGFAPKKFSAEAGGRPVRVQLDPGGLVRVRIVNPESEPIAGASLVLDDGFGDGALGWDGTTDEEGRVEWRSAPPGKNLMFTAYAPGYRYRRGFPLSVDPNMEHSVTLEPALTVVGRVLDAANGEPIARFKAVPGEGREHPNFDRSQLHYGTNGVYRLRFSEMNGPVVRLEAEGFETEVGYPERGPDGEPRCDFKLRRVDPNAGVHGVVLHPDGSPAAGVDVALCTLEKSVMLGQGRFLNRSESILTNTDAQGRFVFPVVRTPHTVAAISAESFGRALVRSNLPVEVRLEPFGAVEGVFLRDGEPQKGKTVQLVDLSYGDYSGAVALDVVAFQAVCNDAGQFRIDRVPAGDFLLYLNPGPGIPFTDETKVSIPPGEKVSVVMGELDPTGRTVVGRLKAPGAVPIRDWRKHLTAYTLSRELPAVKPPAGLSEEARQLWWVEWDQSPAGREHRRQSATYTVKVAADGEFSVRGVPPGEYRLQFVALPEDVARKNPWDQRAAAWRGYLFQNVVVPEADSSAPPTAPPVDFGELEMKIDPQKP